MITGVSYTVDFAVLMSESLAPGEKVYISGNNPALGDWMVDDSLELQPLDGYDNRLWGRSVKIENQRELQYRYFIGQLLLSSPIELLIQGSPSQRMLVRRWETFGSARIVDLFDAHTLLTNFGFSSKDSSSELEPSASEMYEHASIFGKNTEHDDAVTIHQGWLIGQTEINLRIHSAPITLWKTKQENIRCRLKLTPVVLDDDEINPQPSAPEDPNNPSNSDLVDQYSTFTAIEVLSLDTPMPFPLLQTEDGVFYNSGDYLVFKLQTFCPGSLAYQLDFYDCSYGEKSIPGHFGLARILPVVNSDEEKPDNKVSFKKVPILRPHDNKPIGYINIDVLIITSLEHLLEPLDYGSRDIVDNGQPWQITHHKLIPASSRYWRKGRRTLHVGHRGFGASRDAGESPLNVANSITKFLENTVPAFKAAHALGMDMIEFDVQLSKDHVPLIYHDFYVPISIRTPGDDKPAYVDNPFVETIQVAIKDIRNAQLSTLRRISNSPSSSSSCNCPPSSSLESVEPQSTSFFPTLAEVLRNIDIKLGFNIEVKYAMQYKRGDFEIPNYFERNLVVDKILECIMQNAGKRYIVLSSFDPDCCLMLHKKQNRYPVLFLAQGNNVNANWPQYQDERTWTTQSSIMFAASEHFLGISIPSEEIIKNKECVRMAKDNDLILFSWEINHNVEDIVHQLQCLGVDGLICDQVESIAAPQNSTSNCLFMVEELEDEETMKNIYRKRLNERIEKMEAALSAGK